MSVQIHGHRAGAGADRGRCSRLTGFDGASGGGGGAAPAGISECAVQKKRGINTASLEHVHTDNITRCCFCCSCVSSKWVVEEEVLQSKVY